MSTYLDKAGLQVDAQLVSFVETEALPGTGIAADAYWAGLAELVERFMPRNRELLEFRDELQGKIDQWHHEHGPVASDPVADVRVLKKVDFVMARGEVID